MIQIFALFFIKILAFTLNSQLGIIHLPGSNFHE